MMITRDNYEIWFLDYLEGKLETEHREMVREFLRENPDLSEGSEGYIPALTTDIYPVYPHKERLKKAWYDDPLILESTAIAAMEGDLTQEEQVQFEKWAKITPGSEKFMNILDNTKFRPDLTINFPGKGRLKKTTFLSAAWIRIAAVAAILAFAFFIFSPSWKKTETSSLITPDTGTQPKKSDHANSPLARGKSIPLSTEENDINKMATGSPPAAEMPKDPSPEPLAAGTRSFVPIETLEPRSGTVTSELAVYADLILIKRTAPVYYASGEIPLSDYFDHRLQALKASQTKDSFTREEFRVAGLRLFSRIPGRHLTGKKGKDGRLKSITFNTQSLAFSIPVNQ